MITEFDASALKKCFLAGASNLIANKDIINELNAFPVPDGDTGTNMSMTISSAAGEVMALGEQPKLKAQGHLDGVPKGCKGKFGSHPVPALKRVHQEAFGGEKDRPPHTGGGDEPGCRVGL